MTLSFSRRNALLLAALMVLVKVGVLAVAHAWVSHLGVVPQLCTWDCSYYRDIATLGYTYTPEKQGTLAFFPVFPLLVRGVMAVTGASFEWAGIGLNLFLFGAACALLMRWSHDLGLKYFWLPAALWTADRFVLWPMVPYTEGIFALTILLFLNSQRHLRGGARWLVGAALGGLASGVRMVGVSLVAGLGLGEIKSFLRKPHWGALCLALGLAGVVAFFTYVHVRFGSWHLSLESTATWGRFFSVPGFFNSAWFMLRSTYFPTILILGLAMKWVVRPPREVALTPTERWVFFFLFFIPMASTITACLTRFMSVLVLGHVACARWMEQRRAWVQALCWALMLSELGWQVFLLSKFFEFRVFNWAA
ncbi:MAG: hypothetical protein JST16_09795 [Bdellovibrionales bacterium]|nr:hypothetical protein [Bdellovibrionales bacterium]